MSTALHSLVLAKLDEDQRLLREAEERRRADVAKTRQDLVHALDDFFGPQIMAALAEAGLQPDPTHEGPSLLLHFSYGAQAFALTARFRMVNLRRELVVHLATPNPRYDPSFEDSDSQPYSGLGDVYHPDCLLNLIAPYAPKGEP